MNDLIEIRWHGRGGQGAKTASLLLADAAFNTGKYIQGFPEYGPERMGAPITAYNRISNTPMLAAIVKVTGIMTDEDFLEDMKGSFKHKFAKKPEVIEGNMKALELALKEVTKI